MYVSLLTLAALSAIASAHGNHDQSPITGPHKQLWYNTLPGDGGTQVCIPWYSSYKITGWSVVFETLY